MKKVILNLINKNYIYTFPFFILFIFIMVRNAGLYPSVVDEYYYNKFSRQMAFDLLPAPNYLYSLIFKITDACRGGWLECVRIVNLLLYFASAPIIYSISKKFTSPKLALLIVFFSLAGVSNTYTAYFMPESTYFLAFWLLIWALIQADNLNKTSHLYFVGFFLGILSLIKPHGIFLLAPIFLYSIINCHFNQKNYLYALKVFAIIISSCLITKFVIGYLLAGKSGLTIFGSFYSQHAVEILPKNHSVDFIKFFIFQYSAHLGFMFLLFSTPIVNGISNRNNSSSSLNYVILVLIFMAFLIAVSAFYTTALNFQAGESQGLRLHMRYYSFAFPLILILLCLKNNQYNQNNNIIDINLSNIIILIILIVSLYFIKSIFTPFTPNYVDGPEIRGFTTNSTVFYFLSLLSVASLVIWRLSARAGVIFYLIIFTPLYLLFTNILIGKELRNRMFPGPFDNGAMVAKTIIPNDKLNKLLIIGSPETQGILDLSMIYYENPGVVTKTVQENSVLDSTNISKNIEWILYVGNYKIGFETDTIIEGPSFKLIKIINK